MSDKRKFLAELRSKRSLIRHTYDAFVERQTRLAFTCALKDLRAWEEISQRRKLLMLDDITVFAIAGRRLIDLCKLQSNCENIRVKQTRLLDDTGNIVVSYNSDNDLGFYSILSRLVHMSYYFYYDSKRDFKAAMTNDIIERYNAFVRPLPADDIIDGVIITRENKYGAITFKMVDMINSSIDAAEKVIEVCSAAGIELEALERDMWME